LSRAWWQRSPWVCFAFFWSRLMLLGHPGHAEPFGG